MAVLGSLDTEQLTVSTTPVSLSQYMANGLKSMGAEITVQDEAILWTIVSGVDPATDGHRTEAGSVISLITSQQVKYFRAVRADAADATIVATHGSDYTR